MKQITEEDCKKFAGLLNSVATHARFTFDTSQVIAYYKLLAWAQQEFLPKLEANIFEVKSVKQVKKSD